MGHEKVHKHLPALLRKVKQEGRAVVWSCDPMHGNTLTSASGYKTRPSDRILPEVRQFFEVHIAAGPHAGGIHPETPGRHANQSMGGTQALGPDALSSPNPHHHTPRPQ